MLEMSNAWDVKEILNKGFNNVMTRVLTIQNYDSKYFI